MTSDASSAAELADALFQAIVTAGLAAFALVLYRRMRHDWLAWWAGAWALYLVRLGAIIAFLASGNLVWLFWHQVATGWVALAILWAALVFSRGTRWRPWYAVLAVFPLAWGWVAVNGLDRFLLVALPMVLFLSGVTIWTGWTFWRHGTLHRSSGARFVAVVFLLWGLHHLDYPFLRARGAWQPWGYYLDIVFELAVGIGFGLMVLSELNRRLEQRTDDLSRLSGHMLRQQEEERRRLARDLHDETAQTLSAIRMEVGMLTEGAGHGARERLERVLGLVDNGIGAVRRTLADLRPALLEDLGLLAAIRALGTSVAERSGLAVRVAASEAVPRLPPDAELALFRATQEALTNVTRHAGAATVDITLAHHAGRVVLTIADDGRGFAMPGSGSEGHFGLTGMRERITALGGEVEQPNEGGATIRITIPVRP